MNLYLVFYLGSRNSYEPDVVLLTSDTIPEGQIPAYSVLANPKSNRQEDDGVIEKARDERSQNVLPQDNLLTITFYLNPFDGIYHCET